MPRGCFIPLFQCFPQTIPVLHSFCTNGHQFPVAPSEGLPQSAESACVRCSERAAERAEADGIRRFSRVNCRGKFRGCALALSETRGVAACKVLLRRDPSVSFRLSADRRFAGVQEESVPSGTRPANQVHRLRAVDQAGQNIHEQMRSGWLAWTAFFASDLGPRTSDFRFSIHNLILSVLGTRYWVLFRLFFAILLSIQGQKLHCTYATTKNFITPRFSAANTFMHKREQS